MKLITKSKLKRFFKKHWDEALLIAFLIGAGYFFSKARGWI